MGECIIIKVWARSLFTLSPARLMKNYDHQTKLLSKLHKIYTQDETSFFRVLDAALVGVLNKKQLKQLEETLIHQFGK